MSNGGAPILYKPFVSVAPLTFSLPSWTPGISQSETGKCICLCHSRGAPILYKPIVSVAPPDIFLAGLDARHLRDEWALGWSV